MGALRRLYWAKSSQQRVIICEQIFNTRLRILFQHVCAQFVLAQLVQLVETECRFRLFASIFQEGAHLLIGEFRVAYCVLD